jgi:hypothetical protein
MSKFPELEDSLKHAQKSEIDHRNAAREIARIISIEEAANCLLDNEATEDAWQVVCNSECCMDTLADNGGVSIEEALAIARVHKQSLVHAGAASVYDADIAFDYIAASEENWPYA